MTRRPAWLGARRVVHTEALFMVDDPPMPPWQNKLVADLAANYDQEVYTAVPIRGHPPFPPFELLSSAPLESAGPQRDGGVCLDPSWTGVRSSVHIHVALALVWAARRALSVSDALANLAQRIS